MRPEDPLSNARPAVLWLDRPDRPAAGPPLEGDHEADLVVVGGGFTGLWAALLASERQPDRRVIVIEAERIAEHASGRNGGFCSASLTHGVGNGVDRFADELAVLQQLGHANLDEIEAAISRYSIDCGFERTGNLEIATAPWLIEPLREAMELERVNGEVVTWLDRDGVRAEVNSPTYEAAMWRHGSEAMVDPARLAWGLASACRDRGIEIYEHSAMTGLTRSGSAMSVRVGGGSIRCAGVVLGTNAFRSPVKAIDRRIAPVYDHVLATEPLTGDQLESIGWSNRQGISDTSNLFHYSRLTEDCRILWGGYDAVYHFGNKIDASLEQRDSTHRLLAEQFFTTYPQLEGLQFSHRWGGVIDTCTRFAVSFGTAFDGRVSYAVGYTGLGVGATRFGAEVCLDLLDAPDSPLCRLDFVRRPPLPFPPEPFRWMGITITRKELERADRNHGRRGLWLRMLDRLGLGFDS